MKKRQTQIEGWGHEIQIWDQGRQIQIGTEGQGLSLELGPGPGNTNTLKIELCQQ